MIYLKTRILIVFIILMGANRTRASEEVRPGRQHSLNLQIVLKIKITQETSSSNDQSRTLENQWVSLNNEMRKSRKRKRSGGGYVPPSEMTISILPDDQKVEEMKKD